MSLAPVVLFAYKRYEQTKLVLEALSENNIAKDTEIYIFCDHAKSEKDFEQVDKTRKMLQNFDYSAFLAYHLIFRDVNYGLARSVITGVTDIINKYGRVIVVEDDTVTSPDFLEYMNGGLDYFDSNKTIGSIGGYRANVALPNDYRYDIVKLTRTSSYCWATWKDRWESIDWDVSDYNKFKYNIIKRLQFGKEKAQLLDAQMQGRVDSWAIRFAYSLWKEGCYSILPVKTRAKNIGYDNTGTHFHEQMDTTSPFVVEIEKTIRPVNFVDVPYIRKIDKQYGDLFKLKWINIIYGYVKNVLLSK